MTRIARLIDMDRYMKLSLMGLLLLLLTLPAFAEPRGHGRGDGRGGHGWSGQRHHGGSYNRPGYNRGPRVDPGTAILGGIIGGYLWRQWAQPEPPVVVVQPEPRALAPWTPEWYEFCTGRYRSFNPQTGYYMGFDGNPHFCR